MTSKVVQRNAFARNIIGYGEPLALVTELKARCRASDAYMAIATFSPLECFFPALESKQSIALRHILNRGADYLRGVAIVTIKYVNQFRISIDYKIRVMRRENYLPIDFHGLDELNQVFGNQGAIQM